MLDHDGDIDQEEVNLEEECLKVLALHQPVAIDLRLIVAVLKINNDLERIGDLAADIAERGKDFATSTAVDVPFDLLGMSGKVQVMLQRSLDAMVIWTARSRETYAPAMTPSITFTAPLSQDQKRHSTVARIR